MSHTDEPASTTPPASTRSPVRKRDAVLDAMHRYHRATQTEVAAQKARRGVEAAQQAAVQKGQVRTIELPPVQIVGRRLPPDTQTATQESPPEVADGGAAGTAAAPETTALAPLTSEAAASPNNAAQGFTASRVGLLPNALLEQKPSLSNWASTQR